MDNSRLNAAASLHSNHPSSKVGTRLYTYKMEAFRAGADWQKQQFSRLIELINDGLPVLNTEGFDDLVEQINNELEQLK